MVTILKVPIQALNQQMLEGLRAQYPQAVVQFEAEQVSDSDRMDEQQFWAILELVDWRQTTSDAVLAPAVEALSQFSVESIHHFYDLLAQKLYSLDARRFAVQLGSNRFTDDGSNYFSADDFLYARCGVVARGKNFYEMVLQNPARMPKEFTFSRLLRLPQLAYTLKTGLSDYPHVTETWFETFSNPTGWQGITPLKEILENH